MFENDIPNRFYIDRVQWPLLTGNNLNETRLTIANTEKALKSEEWPEHWIDAWLPLWKKIAMYECLEYLEIVLQEHSLPFNPGEKTTLVLENVLEDFSVGQTYNLIWRAGKDAAAFYLRERVPKPHAANTVVGNIQRQAERALAEGWDIKQYRRDRRCPQSVVSKVLFDTALQIGDKGFSVVPNSGVLSDP